MRGLAKSRALACGWPHLTQPNTSKSNVLLPFCKLPRDTLRQRCGASSARAVAISREMLRGALPESTAAATLASPVVSWLSSKK
ncbi:hypothetical protein HK404_02500 [Myxococcus xanthus]|nr:hypothetical protein [Myxococcus xanthus]QPM83372.1 hypothetical protein I5Q59_20355 [Myxococcus xanthus]QVW71936.1 hypothetical protein JTM82_25710 [Myxococcus xanthus DZ2]UEO08583.1 hypothetical protein K1515_17085 [Myxococcus xanthus DZ2]